VFLTFGCLRRRRPGEDLLIGEEAGVEGWVVHLLKGTIAAQSEGRGGRGGLAQNHEDRLHSNGSVGNVGCGKADWDREVLALIDFRQDGAVGNRVGRKSADLDVAFISAWPPLTMRRQLWESMV